MIIKRLPYKSQEQIKLVGFKQPPQSGQRVQFKLFALYINSRALTRLFFLWRFRVYNIYPGIKSRHAILQILYSPLFIVDLKPSWLLVLIVYRVLCFSPYPLFCQFDLVRRYRQYNMVQNGVLSRFLSLHPRKTY